MKLITATVALFLAACDPPMTVGGPDAQGDAGTAGDGTEAGADVDNRPCTMWACKQFCVEGGCGCVQECISREPVACPGPWPCLDGGDSEAGR
jgi:hypothetical protein